MACLGAALLLGAAGPAAAQSARCSLSEDSVLSLFHDRYSVQVSAFAQLQYAAGITAQGLSKSEFSVPRARICASGHALTHRLRYRLMIGRSIQREIEVNDAFAEWEPVDGLALRLGRFKLPVIREWIESARPLATIDRSLATRLLLPGRDYGASVSGRIVRGHLAYLLGVFNGDGDAATRAADTSPAVVARLGLHLGAAPWSGAVDFAGSAAAASLEAGLLWNRWRPPSVLTTAAMVEDQLWNAAAALRWAHFDAGAEYIGQRRADPEKVTWTHAGYVRLTYFMPKLLSSVTGRASVVEVRGDAPAEQVEAEADWGLYLDRHRVKAVLRYAALIDTTRELTEHQLGLQVQVAVY
ncbi:MAG: porin [Polyangia bacterium]